MTDIATRLERQGLASEAMGSPFTAALLRDAARSFREDEDGVGALLDSLAAYSRPGLHLAGALHYLALAGDPDLARHYPSTGGDGDASAAWRAACRLVARDPQQIAPLLRRVPQTNEPARSLPLLCAALFLMARFRLPLRLREVGASAGLNLRFDRFGYAGSDWSWGRQDSPLVLRNRIAAGRPASREERLEIAGRRGCDLHPLDVAIAEDRLRLTSFVWPDQRERMERLRGALAVAETLRVPLDAESYETWLAREAMPHEGCVTVVVHTVVEEHFSREERGRLAKRIEHCGSAATARAPFARVSMELDGGAYRTAVQSWPGPSARTTICLSDGHAQNVVFMATATV